VRYISLDVHREFCEVAISEEGKLRSAGRIRTRKEELELFAQSLGQDDEVVLEVTGGAEAIAAILRPHVARVVVANTKKLRQISEAKQKTDRLDARRLAELLAAGFVAEVWCPDEKTRALRRYVSRRVQLVRQRSRAKDEIAAALQRNLSERPDVDDVASTKGRHYLAELELPPDERNTVDGCLRQITFLDSEIAEVERVLAEAAVESPEMRRLMSVPGVNPPHRRDLHGARRGHLPLRVTAEARLLPRARPEGAPVGRGARALRPHLQRGRLRRQAHALRGGVGRDQEPEPAAGLRRADRGAARRGDRDGRCRPQARRFVLAPAHQGRGLRVQAADAHAAQAASARASSRCRSAPRGRTPQGGRPHAQGAKEGGGGVCPPGRDRLPAPARRLAEGSEEEGRGCPSGARIFKSSS
jgi:hypothetical protein